MSIRICLSLLLASLYLTAYSEAVNFPPHSTGKIEFKDNKMSLYFTGYFKLTCENNLTIYKMENNQWTPLMLDLPIRRIINVDGLYTFGQCDLIQGCTKMPGTITIPLNSYQLIEEKNVTPGDYGFIHISKPSLVPFYKKTPIKGKIKINYSYFEDPLCQKEVVFSQEEVIN